MFEACILTVLSPAYLYISTISSEFDKNEIIIKNKNDISFSNNNLFNSVSTNNQLNTLNLDQSKIK
jgi:hypothetical protein